jgi:glutathione S-transferase
MTLTLHYLAHSQAIRVLWLLEELATTASVDYTLKIYERLPDLQAPPELKALSPLGTSPVLTNDQDGLVLAESNAILDYLLDLAPLPEQRQQLRPPPGTPQRADFLFWFHTGPASFQHAMQTDTLFQIIPTKVPWPLSLLVQMVARKTIESYVLPRVRQILHVANAQLSEHAFLAGAHLTVADIANLYSVESALTRYPAVLSAEDYPHVYVWRTRMLARPALQRALEQVGQSSIVVNL